MMLSQVILLETEARADADDLVRAFATALGPDASVERVRSFDALLERAREEGEAPLLVIHADAREGDATGLELLHRLRERLGDLAVVLVAAPGDPDLEERAVQAGASELLLLGPRLLERVGTLVTKLSRLLEVLARNRELDEQNERLYQSIQQQSRLVGESPQVRRLIAQIGQVARIPRPLLIVGERGTGKELVARAIHFASERPAGTLVTINCAAIGESLLESELFGHEKGAFTGAEHARRGRFEQAEGGTLFLDEIGRMPLAFQEKILRVVEYGTFTRVGGAAERKTSARIIAATNADLRKKIDEGEFLGDLYDRLAFEVIRVPALRERPGDIPILAHLFLVQFADEIPAFRGKRLADSALEMLSDYPFPGNVRELKNIIERAAYRDTTNEITPEDIGLLPRSLPTGQGGSFKARVSAFRRELIENALRETGGNQAEAARRLGLSYDQFRHYHRKHQSS
jgi:DNA-binding NtrC family response regulator